MQDDDTVRPMPRRPGAPGPRGAASRRRRWAPRLLFVVVPLLVVVSGLLHFWVDVLWFDELGQRDVITTRIGWGTATGVLVGLITFGVLLSNFVVARRVARDDLYVPFLAPGADPQAPEQPVVPHFVLRPILLGVALVAAVLSGLGMSSSWETVLRFLGRTDFGITDPHFGKDASFYVFTLPLLELVAHFLQVLLVGTTIAVVIAYVATGVIRYAPAPRIARPATVHLAGLVAAFFFVSAFAYRLSMWNLVTSRRGVVAGAGWTDVHVRIPGLWVMIVASIVLGVVAVLYARRQRWRVVGGAVVAWVAASVLCTGIAPSIAQRVLVEPNELDREHAVLQGNIRNTRAAFDLGDITDRAFTDEAKLSQAELLTANRGTTDNIRLWSPDVLQRVMDQNQSIKRYLTFNDVDVDRYTVDGRYRQVMIAARELDPNFDGLQGSWTSRHLVYTHGYGAVATSPNEVTSEGGPKYLLRDLPPKPIDQEDITLDRPEIYFGEAAENMAIVGSKQREISPAAGEDDRDTATNYRGTGGIPVGGMGRRIALASAFSDPRMLFTNQLTSRSRVLFRRNVRDRVHELAPFLELDADPYAVVHDGRISWVLDAYTTSDRFPYSEAKELGGSSGTSADGGNGSVRATAGSGGSDVNYARNSVKAVVDAYDGKVTLYVADAKDPILRSWRHIFPSLFTDLDEMPHDLRAHLRYPEDLFGVQTALWTRYHMSDVARFYNSDDLWDVPKLGQQDMQAFYVLAKLPGEPKEELLLVRPLTPKGKKNMIAYVAVRSDPAHYGEMVTLRLDEGSLTQGPSQVQALIKQDSDVAEQVRFWESSGNTVLYGNMLVLPIEKSLLYVQPVYLENAEAQIPEYQRVVVVLGNTVAWGKTFEEAVRALLAERAASGGTGPGGGTSVDATGDGSGSGADADAGTGGTDVGPGAGAAAGAAGGAAGSGTGAGGAAAFGGLSEPQLRSRLAQLSAAYDAALECQRRNDNICYAQQLERIEVLLEPADS